MEELTCLNVFVPLKPRIFAVVKTGESVGNYFERLGFFTYAYNVAGINCIGCDVDNLTVDHDVAVKHELTGSCTGRSDAETIDYIVETAFEKLEKDFTCDTLRTRSFVEEVVELLLKHAVGVFSFLLLTELDTILGSFPSLVESVLARGIILLGEDFVFTEDWFAELAGDFGTWTCVSCHFS